MHPICRAHWTPFEWPKAPTNKKNNVGVGWRDDWEALLLLPLGEWSGTHQLGHILDSVSPFSTTSILS